MSQALKYKDYFGSVTFDSEDQIYHGKLLGLRDFVLYEGADIQELEEMFREAVDEYLRFTSEDGKQPEKPFFMYPSRLPADLLLQAAIFAEEQDLDLDTVVEQALSKLLKAA